MSLKLVSHCPIIKESEDPQSVDQLDEISSDCFGLIKVRLKAGLNFSVTIKTYSPNHPTSVLHVRLPCITNIIFTQCILFSHNPLIPQSIRQWDAGLTKCFTSPSLFNCCFLLEVMPCIRTFSVSW